MLIRKNISMLFLLILMGHLVFPGTSPLFVKNTLAEIDQCRDKVSLKLVRIWGDDDTDDENQFFRFPMDIAIDKENNVYIVEYFNHRIQVFDRQGKYIRTIGRPGQGPADFFKPSSMGICKNGNIVVSDSSNKRIQILDKTGNYISSFRTGQNLYDITINSRDQIVTYCHSSIKQSKAYFTLYSLEGKKIQDLCKTSIFTEENIIFCLDKKDFFYIGHFVTPYLRIYSPDGEIKAIVTYETPMGKVDIQMDQTKPDWVRVKGAFEHKVITGITIDNERGLLFITSAKRNFKKSEMVGFSSGSGTRYPKVIETDQTDRYRLLVFDSSGKIFSSNELSVFCDDLYFHEDHLFIVDTVMGMKVYEYQVVFK